MATVPPDFADAEEAAFLDAIRAQPADDALRLVYADWLEERGDPRAEGIRAQIELARLQEADERYPAALARARRSGLLTAPRQRPWVDHVPGGAVLFRRGLIAGVDIPADKYLEHPTDHWQRLPLEQLALTAEYHSQDPGLGAALAARPELAGLHTLRLAGEWPLLNLRPLLTGCPHLADLRALQVNLFRYSGMSDLTLVEAVRGWALPALDSLNLSAPPERNRDNFSVRPPEVWEAAVTACTRPLRRLCLVSEWHGGGAGFEERGLDWLWQTPHWPHLTRLDVYYRHPSMEGDAEYSYSTWDSLPRLLSETQLENLHLDCEEIPEFLQQPTWGSLRSLCLYNRPGDRVPAGALAFADQARRLETLMLDNRGGCRKTTRTDWATPPAWPICAG